MPATPSPHYNVTYAEHVEQNICIQFTEESQLQPYLWRTPKKSRADYNDINHRCLTKSVEHDNKVIDDSSARANLEKKKERMHCRQTGREGEGKNKTVALFSRG